jgi:mono/diheme cytochrome c family protein
MHAYAADDPIFVAMNARGQRETGGALGDFCVRCHAPLAARIGATADGLNLAALPAKLRGVTCLVCHGATVAADGSLDLVNDALMQGPIEDPLGTLAHGSAYSVRLDRQRVQSVTLCGECHTLTNGHGLEVERTADEWRTTSYALPSTLRTCGRCHMPETIGAAANVSGAPARAVHDHAMPGVDLGTDSPAQRKLVEQTLAPAISSRLCVVPAVDGVQVTVTLDNALVGHAWPSGATHDRRAWLELVGYRGTTIVYSSGLVSPDEAVTASPSAPLVLLREQLFDDSGQPTLFMWNATSARSLLLAPAAGDPLHSTQTAAVTLPTNVDRVTARVRVRAIDYDVVDALVSSGDLAPSYAKGLPTLTVRATAQEWTTDRGAACLP